MKMDKEYCLRLENIGTDVYTLMSKGHHDLEKFKTLVNEEFPSWVRHLGKPEHIYFKRVFDRYIECESNTRGSFPVTYITEGED